MLARIQAHMIRKYHCTGLFVNVVDVNFFNSVAYGFDPFKSLFCFYLRPAFLNWHCALEGNLSRVS